MGKIIQSEGKHKEVMTVKMRSLFNISLEGKKITGLKWKLYRNSYLDMMRKLDKFLVH